jgi:hypothetical protein
MAEIFGLAESFTPGSVEYSRVEFDITKNKYYRPDRTSILLLTGMGDIPGAQQTNDQKKATISFESKVVDNLEFEIMTHDARLNLETTFVAGNLTTGTAGTAKVFTVTDASIFRPFDIAINETTGEQFLITAVNTSASPDEITAYPGFGSVTPQGLSTDIAGVTLTGIAPTTKTATDVLRITGNAFPEGSTAGNIIDSRPTTAINYVQIFREEFGVTFEEQQAKKNGRMDIADKDERALGDMLKKIERALVEGRINKVVTPSGTVRSMAGIKSTVVTNTGAITSLVGSGTEMTIPRLDQIADLLSPANVSGKLIALCSGGAIRKLRELMDGKVEIKVEVGSEDFGIKALRYESTFLPIDFVRHDIMDQGNNSDEILFFDPAHYELVNLRGGELGYVSEKKGLSAGTANNDKMAIQDAHYAAYSLEFRHEAAAGLYTGITYNIAS